MKHPLLAGPSEPSTRGISRRASLWTLGATGLTAAFAAPFAAEAKKKCKKKRKTCPSLEEVCAPHVEDCRQLVAISCGGGPGCDRLVECCDVFETCDAGLFVACIGAPPT